MPDGLPAASEPDTVVKPVALSVTLPPGLLMVRLVMLPPPVIATLASCPCPMVMSPARARLLELLLRVRIDPSSANVRDGAEIVTAPPAPVDDVVLKRPLPGARDDHCAPAGSHRQSAALTAGAGGAADPRVYSC